MIRKNIFLTLLTATMVFAGCEEQYTIGDFETDATLTPGPRTDGPIAPAAIVASYDDFCDKVEINWMPTVRTTAYDVYKNGEVLAAGLTDTFYVDTEAMTVDTEYTVYSVNANGDSETSAMTVGRMAATPAAPTNFEATDGAYESKVDLSWDAVDFAQHYIVKRGDVVLSDAVIGTTFSDSDNAPTEAAEYTLIAVSVCGESTEVTTTGYCDPLIAFRFPINENFDGYDVGFNLSSMDLFQHMIQYDPLGGPGTFTVTDETSVSGAKSAKVIYNDVNANTSAAGSIQLIFSNFSLLEGERYRISYKLKCTIPTSMHIAVDGDGSGNPSKGDGVDNYLLPTAVNTKNGNLYGIQMDAKPEWTEVSYEFPATGDLVQNDLDPDATALAWTPTTIQAGQETPLISITYWVGKNKAPNLQNPPIYLDDLKIELIK
ncbi:hypothetical protein KDU71_11320 [Carboxylicivirga sediminis]|uniref:Uncharacterized protein n=1 Tax=Carboxylicivirga sediminis TaxID=2006564 RepID=A0A941F568_9BACT|nr:hypothetical protein [Carboxylicivirga sediminis]MBR8536149.1 hypothetical protein [Carboxylicivirga sediminis]